MSVFSDETDVLLLIPPDFFAVHDDDSNEETIDLNKPIQRLLVSDLISQVNDLEGRICMIENQKFPNMPIDGNLERLRHFGSVDTLNIPHKVDHNSRSLQNTPVKNNTLPSIGRGWRAAGKKCLSKYSKGVKLHPNMLTSYQYINQQEKDDQLLKEIHDFFRHKNSKNNEVADENKIEEGSEYALSSRAVGENINLSTAVFNLNKVNNLLKQLEETQAEIEQKLKLKGLNGTDFEENKKSFVNSNKCCGVLAKDDLKGGKTEGSLSSHLTVAKNEELCKEKKDSVASSSLTVPTDEICLNLKDTNLKLNETLSTDELQTASNEFIDIPSLCKLWGSDRKTDEISNEEQKAMKQKYEEEKCRRLHCEELIQQLHVRLLEEQQKIAVAIKVDQEKDEAISKLTEAWNKLVGHWKELESQKNFLGKKLETERQKFQNEVSVACQTVKRYEVELSKALDLAHGYKEKCELSEKERENQLKQTEKEMENLKAELLVTSEKLQKEYSHAEKLQLILAAKEENLTQLKSKVFDLQNEVREWKKKLRDQQIEADNWKHEKDKLGEKLREEKSRTSALEQSKKSLLQSNEELKKREKSLKENIKGMTEQIEKIKADLKKFYQEQVEKIVQEKLKEFQEQLASAEKTLQKEIEERERKVTELAVKQVQQIVEKHVLEVNLLEEKHNQEIELWKVKVLRAEEKVQDLQRKLNEYSSQKSEIAQKLQSVMETQWQEALKIITASSPQHQKSTLDSDRSDPPNQLNRQNTFTKLSSGFPEEAQSKNDPLADSGSPSESTLTEIPFCKDGQLTFRGHSKNDKEPKYRIDETPQKIEAAASNSLKNYIQMLLERPPGVPIDDSTDKSLESIFNSLVDGSDSIHWQHILSEQSK